MRALVIALALFGCSKRFDPDQLVTICDGTGFDGAAAYDPATPITPDMPLAFVERYPDLKHWIVNTPGEFNKAGFTSPTADTIGKTQLAYCVEQQPGPFDRDCGMDDMNATLDVSGGDKTHVESTGRKSTIKAFGSHYVLTVREAKTARVLASKQLDVKVAHCPLITLGPSKNDYAPISDQARLDAIAPFLPKGSAARIVITPNRAVLAAPREILVRIGQRGVRIDQRVQPLVACRAVVAHLAQLHPDAEGLVPAVEDGERRRHGTLGR